MQRLPLFLLLGSTATFGSPITLTFTGIATGSFDATPFTDASFTVTSNADTSSVFVNSGMYEIPANASSIDIAGFSPAIFTDSTLWEDPQGAGDIEFNDATLGAGLLGFTKLFEGLENYQFQASIGPISSGIVFAPNIFETFQNIPTSLGSLTITSTSSNTFTAVVTPEPAWQGFVGFAALLLLGLRRRAGTEG